MGHFGLIQRYAPDFGIEREKQCYDCGGFLLIGDRGRFRCAGCALLDNATWQYKDPRGCWSWTGNRVRRRGAEKKDRAKMYGQMHVGEGKKRGVHRVAFATWTAPILPFWDVLRLPTCDDLGCVQPDHICLGRQADRLGTHAPEFARRMPPRRGFVRPGGWRVWGDNCTTLFAVRVGEKTSA